MTITGFDRAQRAYENMEAPSSGDCPCLEQEIHVCAGCGEDWNEPTPPDTDRICCTEPERTLLPEDALLEDFPLDSCPEHGDNEPDPDYLRDSAWDRDND
jgi:hypothetical protein